MILDRVSLQALADARRSTRAALAAMRAMDLQHVSHDDTVQLSCLAALLADAAAELTAIESRARLNP